jgi:two-component system, NarL family, sensor kinase
LVIEICDDGIGFMEQIEARTIGGLGVPSMKERAAELGGELTIERMIEGGTRISAWIPLIKEIEGESYENNTSAISG